MSVPRWWWGAACEGVMAAATELSHPSSSGHPSSSDSSLEGSCSPNLSLEVLCEVFRSLHTLAGQVSGGTVHRAFGSPHSRPLSLQWGGGGECWGEGFGREAAEDCLGAGRLGS